LREYLPWIDREISKELDKADSHFKEIWRTVNENRPKINERTISSHLKRMEDNLIIIKHKNKRGMKGSYQLTRGAKILKENGLLNLDFDNKKYTSEGKEEKRIYFNAARDLFLVDYVGTEVYTKKSKAEPGDPVINGYPVSVEHKKHDPPVFDDVYEDSKRTPMSKINLGQISDQRMRQMKQIIEKGIDQDWTGGKYGDISKEEREKNFEKVQRCMQGCDALVKLNIWKIYLKQSIGELNRNEIKWFYDLMGQRKAIDFLSKPENDNKRANIYQRLKDIDEIIKAEQYNFAMNIKKINRTNDSWSYDACIAIHDLCDPESRLETKYLKKWEKAHSHLT
jgi:DNA-binding HxlR family transcriptional regulator